MSVCRVLPIAPSTYYEHVAQRQDPTRLSARARQDLALKPEIARVFGENFAVYGVRKDFVEFVAIARELGTTAGSLIDQFDTAIAGKLDI